MTYTLIFNIKKRIDSSTLVAIAFNEPSASILIETIVECEKVFFSSFLEAKFSPRLRARALSFSNPGCLELGGHDPIVH